MLTEMIYLDNNATTRLDDAVLEAMLPFLREQFGNPASGHAWGRAARDAVEQARHEVASLIGGDGHVIFTSTATEANNLLIGGVLGRDEPCHAVTSAMEHKSILEPLKHWEAGGRVRVTRLSPDPFGRIPPELLDAAIAADTRLVSLMAASNVIHTLNPVADMARVCADRNVLFHTDATQWIGRLPMDVDRLGIDAMSFSAHKLYGPKGAGALYLSRRAFQTGITPLVFGGGQEEGLRSGTLNVPAIVGFGAACRLAAERQEADGARARELAQLLWEGLTNHLGGVTLNGHPQDRIPGGLHITFDGVDSQGLLASVPELAFSDGAACETERAPDYILRAIGKPQAAHHSVRLQIGRTTTREEIESAVRLLVAGVERMRAFAF